MRRARPVWIPSSGENAIQTPIAEGEGDPVRRVLDAEEDRAPSAGAGSLAAGSAARERRLEMIVRRRGQGCAVGCPPRRNDLGLALRELADHGERQVPDHGQVA